VNKMDWPLYVYIFIIFFGFFISSPLGSKIQFQRFNNDQSRIISGSIILAFGGFLVSTHTYFIHERLHEIGGTSGCSAFSVFDCGDVISNGDYNTDPIFGIPWGVLGMLSFAAMLFILIVLRNSPEDPKIGNWISVMLTIPALGMVPILWLIYVEFFELGVFCQYCTVAHIANLFLLISSYWVYDLHHSGLWNKTKNSD